MGRQSKSCHGFGVCEVILFGIGIYELPPKEGPVVIGDVIDYPDGKSAGLIYLNKEVNGEEYDTLFHIDSDIHVKDKNGIKYVFKAGEYQIDKTLGEFGGYKIVIEKE